MSLSFAHSLVTLIDLLVCDYWVLNSGDDRYKIGDSFVSLPLPEVQELLAAATEKIEEEVAKVEERLGGVREEMRDLKVKLYARFGRSINLET